MGEANAGAVAIADSAVEIRVESDIVAARQAGRDLARELGFGSADQTRLATAISELARNVIRYAGRGVCTINDEADQEMMKIRVVVEDHGPGIPDVHTAMRDGFSTSNSLGVGLPAARRLVHEFDVSSEPGHTVVTMVMVRRRL